MSEDMPVALSELDDEQEENPELLAS